MVHRKTVRHFHEVGHLHELTFSCYRRMPLLTNDTWREILAKCIGAAGEETAIELVGFVFMPEHVHLLVYPKTVNPSISLYLARLKQPFSKHIKDILVGQHSRLLSKLMVRERPGKECFRFWQEGPGFDRNLFSPKAISSSLEYIHNNPVSRGLCRCAVDWKWSSARYYLDVPSRQQHPSLPMIHRLPEGAVV
ncbi:MAG: transposase [Pirellulales bacterium]|nr:transposase [Pirellulales bacterium]